MGAIPDEHGYWVCNVVWMLDDFTHQNGALRAVPGSHRWRKLPQDVLDDATQPHQDEIVLTGQAGSVIVMNAHLWHGGLMNQTAKPRTAVHTFFCRRDKPQQQHQKMLLDEELQSGLPEQLRELLALDDAANDALSSGSVTRSGFLK
jgi:ectoine hydroxylase-related dioxygenase (phytanoyl-CoA dioxygenase family)